jgi:hypothetical protein
MVWNCGEGRPGTDGTLIDGPFLRGAHAAVFYPDQTSKQTRTGLQITARKIYHSENNWTALEFCPGYYDIAFDCFLDLQEKKSLVRAACVAGEGGRGGLMRWSWMFRLQLLFIYRRLLVKRTRTEKNILIR